MVSWDVQRTEVQFFDVTAHAILACCPKAFNRTCLVTENLGSMAPLHSDYIRALFGMEPVQRRNVKAEDHGKVPFNRS